MTAARNTVRIDVTPLFRQGNEVICDIQPQPGNVKGGMIHLGRGNNYTLEFALQPGTNPALQNLQFRTDQQGNCEGFWCDAAGCPTHSMLNGQYRNPAVVGGRTLRVEADPVGQDPSAVHYRLNFDNPLFFDPIIIHD